MIQSLLCNLDIEGLLPLLKSRAEADSIIGVAMLGHQLDAAVTSLLAATKHYNMLKSLHRSILFPIGGSSSGNKFNRAMIPLLARLMTLSKSRTNAQLDHISTILEELRTAEKSMKQYAIQNKALARELEGVPEVAFNKKKLSQLEMDICERLSALLRLASDNTSLQSKEFIERLESLDGTAPSPDYKASRKRDRHMDTSYSGSGKSMSSVSTHKRAKSSQREVDVSVESPLLRLYQTTPSTGLAKDERDGELASVKDSNELETSQASQSALRGPGPSFSAGTIDGGEESVHEHDGEIENRKKVRSSPMEDEENDPSASQNSATQFGGDISVGGPTSEL